MATQVAIPQMGESVSEVILLEWLKADGDYVERDEAICILETDKANVDLPAPVAGILRPLSQVDDTLAVGDAVANIEEGSAPVLTEAAPAAQSAAPASDVGDAGGEDLSNGTVAASEEEAVPSGDMGPAARRLVEEHGLDPARIAGSGKDGRLTKQDVLDYIKENEAEKSAPAAPAPQPVAPVASVSTPPKVASVSPASPPVAKAVAPPSPAGEGERREPMSRLRQRIASRLVEAQQTAAILSTFNEVDLKAVMDLRARHKERFSQVHGVSLGLMSFFSRAVALALRDYPTVNASIDGTDIIYHDHVHLGIAVSTERGLLVPVLRHIERLGLAEIEGQVKRLALAARDNKLGLDELSGATFTITNGGVFGSLLSTPILTPPQSGILGMHTIKERPVAVDGQVVVRPMMYVALSYDHRLVDGQQSVSFLVRLKELLEDPTRLFLEI
jgi:2-oxoglutarate dehydrogenase E2 component (dihydrolipoamide succinyltransferase)